MVLARMLKAQAASLSRPAVPASTFTANTCKVEVAPRALSTADIMEDFMNTPVRTSSGSFTVATQGPYGDVPYGVRG